MPAPTPPLVPQPFAQSGTRNVIPDTTANTQRASFELGFPPATMQPIDAGGVPPLGQDFNGILFDVTAWLYALQGGQIQPYDSGVSDAIGGYAVGALVLMADGDGYWINTAAANTTDPDAGGAGWQPVYAYGASAISGLTGGSRTLTAIEASRYFLVLTGALVANQQIVVPNAYRNYLIINACTGAFTLTVQTAAGTGVAVVQGGAAHPTAVWCDTVNVNPVFVPSALPTSVSPEADTLVLRDNTGAQFALTATVGTRTTQVASTEFVIPAAPVIGTAGSITEPTGLIRKWGFHSFNGSPVTVNFPVAFPTACYNIQLTPINTGAALPDKCPVLGSISAGSFTMQDADGTNGTYWSAIGK